MNNIQTFLNSGDINATSTSQRQTRGRGLYHEFTRPQEGDEPFTINCFQRAQWNAYVWSENMPQVSPSLTCGPLYKASTELPKHRLLLLQKHTTIWPLFPTQGLAPGGGVWKSTSLDGNTLRHLQMISITSTLFSNGNLFKKEKLLDYPFPSSNSNSYTAAKSCHLPRITPEWGAPCRPLVYLVVS